MLNTLHFLTEKKARKKGKKCKLTLWAEKYDIS